MEKILDGYGKVISESANMRGIREYAGKHLVWWVRISELERGRGKLKIRFDGGARYETEFESFLVLKGCVRRWRNLYGAQLFVDWEDAGFISFSNDHLK